MNTRTKLRIAHALYWMLTGLRRLIGRTDSTQVTRRGIRWQLDLREGIDLAIYLFGYFEYKTVRAYRRLLKPGDIVLDIGANIGAHVLPLAHCVLPRGKVIAFEPTTYAYNKLRQNIMLNPHLAGIIQTEQIMLVDSENRGVKPRLYSSWQIDDAVAVANSHPKHGGRLMDTTGARNMTLDRYIAEHDPGKVSFIKMDVDGHECQVLRGALALLRRDKPILLMEIMPYGLEEHGESLEKLFAILLPLGYRLFRLDGSPLYADHRLVHHIPEAGGINVIWRHV